MVQTEIRESGASLARRLREVLPQVQLALAEAQWSSWQALVGSPAAILRLDQAASGLKRAAHALDGPDYDIGPVPLLVFGCGPIALVAITLFTPRSVLPLALGLGYVASAAAFLIALNAHRRRARRTAELAYNADTVPIAERVNRSIEQVNAVLMGLQPELGPKRTKADLELRQVLQALTAASAEL